MSALVKRFVQVTTAGLVLALCLCQVLYADPADPGVRTLSPEDGLDSTEDLKLAPGYCTSIGGSLSYESISSVSAVQTGQTMTITVYIWIANPTGCTAGSPCPEYDASPEYINAWIDWNGNEVWESHEKVMDVALTGYLGINYQGTMTGVAQVTVPPNAVGTPWLRANLGWDHDPNDPCDYSWTWGDVQDKQLQLVKVNLLKVETVDNIEIEGVSNVIWERRFTNQIDCDLENIDVTSVKPIAAPFTKGAFGLQVTVGYCPSQPSWDPKIVCKWKILEVGIDEETTTWGWKKRFNVLLPQKVGKYTLDLKVSVYDDQDERLDEVSLPSRTLYVTYDFPKLGEPIKETWIEIATKWASGANTDFSVCSKIMDYIYDPAPWDYDPNLTFEKDVWKDLLDGSTTAGHCKFFAEAWAKVGQILGVGASYDTYEEMLFITKTPAIALDDSKGNITNGSTGKEDRWRFEMHAFGVYPLGFNNYYDPTFGKTYDSKEQYIEWYRKGLLLVPSVPPQIIGDRYGKPKTGQLTEHVDLYSGNYNPYLAYHYYGPYYPAASPWQPASALLASASDISNMFPSNSLADGASFTGNYYVTPIDSDGDGRYNRVSVGIEVDVTSLEEHFLGGLLMFGDSLVTDRSGIGQIVPSVYEVDSSLGLDTVVVDFCGEDILKKGYDGDYSFYFSLSDSDHNLVDVFEFSAPYSHSQFGEIPARITGITDRGVDSDGNGLYDRLEIEIALSNHIAGRYFILGNLIADDKQIESKTATADLDAGDVSAVLSFSGKKISRSGKDGPYIVTLSLEDTGYGVIDYRSFVTSAYNHTQFQKNKAKPLDLYEELPIDTDGNGLYDILRMQYDIQIDSAGIYFVNGWLEDSVGEAIDLFEISVNSMPGTRRVDLDFAGAKIYEHGSDGPYVLRFLTIRDEDSKLVDAIEPGDSTAAYSYLAFERPVPPLIALTGNYADYGHDTDGNGLYDYLTVGVEVTCSDDGVAIANARLAAPDGEEILWTSAFAPVTANVPAMIPLDFDGRYVYGSLQDGRYRLLNLIVYHTGDPSQSAHISEPHVTSPYQYMDFERSAVICGTVMDYDAPIPGAFLSIEGGDYDYTNSDGYYNLVALQSGSCLVEIEAPEAYEIDSWFVFVNDVFIGEGTAATVAATVGEVTQVDFTTAVQKKVDLDIKPGSCPNPLNVRAPKTKMWDEGDENPMAEKAPPDGIERAKAVLPVAILGTANFEVANIDPTTVMLEGVPALRWNIEDVSAPVSEEAEECECNTLGPDSYPDLTLKFDKCLIVEALGEVHDGDTISLTISGELSDGAAIEGNDCVVIRGGGESDDGGTLFGESPTVTLVGNYPNPFNPTTEISFSLPSASHVKLEVFNVMGQKVATVVDKHLEAGDHSVTWDGSQVASGVYFYRLDAGDFSTTRKMILLK